MASLFQSTLADLVASLRSSSLGETAFLENALAECKKEIRSTDPHIKATALQKVTYIAMLQGADMGWAAFHCLEVMSQARFWHKQAGYLGMCAAFADNSDLLLLATNLFKKDLTSTNEYEAGQAINALSRILTPSLARDLLPDICQALTSSRVAVRKRAVLVLHHFFLKDPDNAPHAAFKHLVDRMKDSDTSVVCCTVNVLCELICSSAAPSTYLPLAPSLFALLTQSSNTWLVIKLVKLFGVLAPYEPRLAAKLAAPLMAILQHTPAKSLAYECVRTTTACLPDHPELTALCAQKLQEFIQDTDPNLRYLGLLALTHLLPNQAAVVLPHRATALACLTDADPTIQQTALRLVRGLVRSADDASETSERMLAVVRSGGVEPEFQFQLVEALLDMHAEQHYAHVADFSWYVGVLVECAQVVGSPHGSLVGAQLVDIGLRVQEVRPDLVSRVRDLLLAPSLLLGGPSHPSVSAALGAAAWVTGEYAAHMKDPTATLEALLQPNVALLPADVQAIYAQAILKLLVHALTRPQQASAPSPAAADSSSQAAASTARASPQLTGTGTQSGLSKKEDNNGMRSTSSTDPQQATRSGAQNENAAEHASVSGTRSEVRPESTDGLPLSTDVVSEASCSASDACGPPRGSAQALARLVNSHLGRFLQSEHAGVQERAGNVAALLCLLDTADAQPALQLLGGVPREELQPVAARAQSLVERPEGLVLETTLESLAGLVEDEGPGDWGVEARAREEVGTSGEQPLTDESAASEEARALHAQHRQRHGHYYLPTEEPTSGEATWQQESAAPDIEAAPVSSVPKRKPARAIVKLDEDLPPGVSHWTSGEAVRAGSASSSGGLLEQSVASLLAGTHGQAGDSSSRTKPERKHRSRHKDIEKEAGANDNQTATGEPESLRRKSSRHHKHKRRAASEVGRESEQEKEMAGSSRGPARDDLPPLISFSQSPRGGNS